MVCCEVHQSNQKTDADLLKEFSGSGSHAAFAALAERHGPMVHAVALRVLCNHHDAQDVTQAVFLALSRKAAKLSGEPSVAGWLHTVARRLALDARRSAESRQRREQAAMKHEANTTPDATLSAGFRRELDAALALLPDRYRQPLVLFHLEDASLHEVAQRLDLQPSTLRTRLSRARDLLRQVLIRRGVGVASVGVLGSLFAAEAKATAFPTALLATVLNNATGAGGTVAPGILKLADKAATITTNHVSSIATFVVLMKTKAMFITAAVIALATIGTTTYVIEKSHEGTGKESGNPRNLNVASQDMPANDQSGKARARAGEFQSLEEAEQALLVFDLTPMITGNNAAEAEQCRFRYRSLIARIPQSYYSELARRMGEGNVDQSRKDEDVEKGPGQTLQQFIRQMALYQEWGRVDFEAAFADLSNIEKVKTHSKALHNVFVGAMEADPPAAMKKAESLDIKMPGEFGESERIDLMDTIFDHWIGSDPFSAIEWARQAAVPAKRRDQWIADGLRAWNKMDPAAAAKWRKQ